MPRMLRFLLPVLASLALAAALPAQAPGSKDSGFPDKLANQSLEEWIKKLEDKDPSTRDAAVRILPSFGPAAMTAIPKMSSMIVNDTDATVRVNALIAVTTNSFDNPKLMSKIVEHIGTLLNSQQTSMRIQAALAAARLGKQAKPVTGRIIDLLRDQASYEVRRAAAAALGTIPFDEHNVPEDRAIIALLGALSDPALVVRIVVVRSLVQLGSPSTVDSIYKERESLLRRLDAKGSFHEPDPALQLWLRTCMIRLDVTITTIPKTEFGPGGEKVIKDSKARIDAGLTLIAKELGNEKLRITAAEALANLGVGCLSKLPDVMLGLKDDKKENYEYMVACLWTIARIGPDARAVALADVTKLTNHSDENVKAAAKYALDRLNGKKN